MGIISFWSKLIMLIMREHEYRKASKEISLEVSVETAKCKLVYRQQTVVPYMCHFEYVYYDVCT